jgi:hypothetical protein
MFILATQYGYSSRPKIMKLDCEKHNNFYYIHLVRCSTILVWFILNYSTPKWQFIVLNTRRSSQSLEHDCMKRKGRCYNKEDTCNHSSQVNVLMWVIFLQSIIIPHVENVWMSNFFICALFLFFSPSILSQHPQPCDKFFFFEHLKNSYCGWQVDDWWMKFTHYG